MAVWTSCPDGERLRRLLDGVLAEAEQDELIAHLDGCPDCQQMLERLAGTERIQTSELTALNQPSHVQEAPLQRVLAGFKADSRTTFLQPIGSQTAWLRTLLRPAASLDVLGQLEAYEVTEVLGQGGMGIVLKAFDTARQRWVAIKLLAPHLADDRVARQRFAREGLAAAAVHHEHIVSILAVSEANGLPFIVMEYLGGGSLQTYVNSHGPLDGLLVAQLGLQLAEALAAAQAMGLVHRDIKPANILMSGEPTDGPGQRNGAALSVPQVKIGDFGLARVADDAHLTQSGVIAGTPMYMAPEQTLGETLDGRSDLFSLGSVLYTLCTGREPFPGTTPMAVLRKVCEATPVPIREINPAIPGWLIELIERLHAKRPADRFASAAEVAELFRCHLAQPELQQLAAPPLRREPPVRSAGRFPGRRAAGVGGALIALVALALLGVWRFAPQWLSLGSGAENPLPLHALLEGHESPIWSVAFAPDGKTLATGSDDGTVRLWHIDNVGRSEVLTRHQGSVSSVAFAHSGRFLASGGGDGILKLWTFATGKEQTAHKHRSGGIRRIAIAPDDATVAIVGTDRTVELWDLAGQRRRALLTGQFSDVAYAPQGQPLATIDSSGVIKLWDPATGGEQASFRGDELGVRALAFAPDSQQLATAGTGDKFVKLWQIPGGQPLSTFAALQQDVLTLAYSPDGRYLAMGSRQGTIRIWDLRTAETIASFTAHRGSVRALTFSPDGRLLASVGEDRLGKLWELDGLGAAGP